MENENIHTNKSEDDVQIRNINGAYNKTHSTHKKKMCMKLAYQLLVYIKKKWSSLCIQHTLIVPDKF